MKGKLTSLAGKKLTTPYDTKAENRLADAIKLKIHHRLEASVDPMKRYSLKDTMIFELKLIDFCLENMISLNGPDYRQKAIDLAARQHPKLDPKKRSNHRPRKVSTALTPSLNQIRLQLVDELVDRSNGRMTTKEALTIPKEAEHDRTERLFAPDLKSLEVALSKEKQLRKK